MLKKTILFLAVLAACSTGTWAQDAPILDVAAAPADSMNTAEVMAQLTKVRAEIDKLSALIGGEYDKTISSYEAGQAIYDSLSAFSYEFDDLTYVVSSALPEPEATVEEGAVEEGMAGVDTTAVDIYDSPSMDDDNTNVKPSAPRKSAGSYFGFGLAGLAYQGVDSKPLEPSLGRSIYSDFMMTYSFRLGGNNSRVSLGTGLGIRGLMYHLDTNYITVTSSPKQLYVNGSEDVKSSRFGFTNLYMPLQLEYRLSKKYKMSVGGYGAYTFSARNITRFEDEDDGKVRTEVTVTRNYYLNKFQYGASVGISNKFLAIIARYQLNELFNAPGIEGAYPWTVGIYFGGGK